MPDIVGQARQQIEKRLAVAVGGRRIVDDVRWALERRPELLREGLEATAAALGLHPRTLQRRLQTEGFASLTFNLKPSSTAPDHAAPPCHEHGIHQ